MAKSKSTATKTVDFAMEYEQTCPPCAEAGNPGVKLGFSVDHGGICCATGAHQFESLPGDGNQVVNPQTPSIGSPEASQTPTVRIKGGFGFKAGEPIQGGPSAQETADRMRERLQDAMREKAVRGEVGPINTKHMKEPELPAPVVEAAVEIPGRVRVSNLKPAAGGNATFTLTLKESLLQPVRAEAEVQRMTVEQFLQDCLDRNLESWIFA